MSKNSKHGDLSLKRKKALCLTSKSFTNALKNQGYEVSFRELRACDYGAPTTRKRLFLIARRDGRPIIWPEPTHAPRDSEEVRRGELLPYHSAVECIDWSLPGKSIFGRKKPLSPNTMQRIARGLKKFVFESHEPFVLRIGQTGYGKDRLVYPLSQPLTTITTKAEHCLVTPFLAVNNTGHPGSEMTAPMTTITTGGHQMLVSSFLSKYFGGNYQGAGIDMREPTDTITSVDHHSLVNVSMTNEDIDREPEIQLFFEENFDQAFLTKYYGSDIGQDVKMPLHTIPTKDRFGLVRVHNQNYRITDITLRMLQPHELAKAQGVPDTYILDRDKDGKKISKAKQVARIGNMVVPSCAKALVEANLPELCSKEIFNKVLSETA
ncbi:DNA cytosine methyltransferase [Pseudolactococcus yaeyamensis]